MVSDFTIESTTCLTCNNAFLKELNTIQGVFGATIDRISGKISISHTDEITPEALQKHLEGAGMVVRLL